MPHGRGDQAVAADAMRLLAGAFYLDHSTSMVELGSLFERSGTKPVQRLKRALADAYGMAWSFPSTHGTTMLNILALLTACPPGGRVLVNRDAHMSVTAAMIHGGLTPVYLQPAFDDQFGMTLGPTLEAFRAAAASGHIDAVFLTSPNYCGVVGDLDRIIDEAHRRGLPVVVDAAHAPHFHFCDLLPRGAEELGADFVTQSTHKVASALSQGSLLLIRNEGDVGRLYEHVNDLGLVSTSFSYPILASIELGVRQLIEEGDILWRGALGRAQRLADAFAALPGLRVFRHDAIRPGFASFDATRVTVDVSGTGFTGVACLIAAMSAIVHQAPGGVVHAPPPPPQPPLALIPRAAKFAPKQRVPFSWSVDRISGETVATYPPGVPIITAGEVITREVLDYLRLMQSSGATLKGAGDPSLRTMSVVADDRAADPGWRT